MPRPDPPEIDHPYVFSVSQIENFNLCARKWAFDKIDGIEEPETPAQALGTAVHDCLENYLAEGIEFDTDTEVGQIAMSGHRHLPLPRTPGMRVEQWFAIQFGVAAYRGLKDVEILSPGRTPLVIDHKTTRSFKWQKTQDELVKDIQAGIYAADAMQKTGSDVVRLKWIYYRTAGARKSDTTPALIRKHQVQPILHRVNETAKKMIVVLNTVNTAMEAEPNFSSCDAYGGCPHKYVRCAVTATGALKSLMRQKMAEESRENKFLSQLRKAANSSPSNSGGALEVKAAEVTVNAEEAKNKAATIPEPPKARKIGTAWVQPVWDAEKEEWGWPAQSIDAMATTVSQGKEKIAEQKKAAEGTSPLERFRNRKAQKSETSGKSETKTEGTQKFNPKTRFKGKGPSSTTVVQQDRPSVTDRANIEVQQAVDAQTVQELESLEGELDEEMAKRADIAKRWDQLLDLLADLVVEKIKKK